MDVAVTELRTHLSRWLGLVGEGAELVITDRGVPIARVVPVDSSGLLARLTEQGVISAPSVAVRPRATGRPGVASRQPVADRVSADRR